jgi:hypothetical protein
MGEIVKKTTFSLGNPGHFITDSEAIYHSDRHGRTTVPPNFSTDFASIPNWVPRWLFDPMRHARWSALFHDYRCRRMADTYEDRVIADHVFLECMHDEGIKPWRRWSMFSAVRANTYRLKIFGNWK